MSERHIAASAAHVVGSPALTKEVHWHGVFWTGEGSALVAAGLCTADQLPGSPGQKKTSNTISRAGGRKFWILRRSKGRVQLYLSREELAARSGDRFQAFMARTLDPVPVD